MLKSLKPYAPLAQDPEKFVHPAEAEEEATGTASRESRICSRKRLFLFFSGTLSLIVLLATGTAVRYGLRGERCRNERGVGERDSALVLQPGLRRRAEPSPTFFTSTYSGGAATSTFVYTTRDIVNPAGVIIGTLTGNFLLIRPRDHRQLNFLGLGYVPSPTSSPSLPSSITSEDMTTSSAPTTTNTASSVDTTAVTPRTFRSKIRPTLTFSPSLPAETSLIEARSYPQDQWSEVDAHLLHKRAFSEPPSPTPAPEYSYSILSDGATKTFVKTTRAIVNPAGVTIGTLSGAFVKLPTPTLPHNPKHTLKQEQETVAVETQGGSGRASGELRKREE